MKSLAPSPKNLDSVLQINVSESRGIDFFDVENPRSLINLVGSNVQSAIKKIPKELLLLTEQDHERRLKGKIGPEISQIRLAFWYEYDRAQTMMRKMNMTNVFGGVVSLTYFNKKVLSDPSLLAYIITPFTEYELAIKELMMFGLGQIRDILHLPHVKDNGEPDPKMCEVKVKIVQDLITRDRGSVIQKIEARNMNVNVDVPAPQVEDLREVERQIAELEGEVEVIDIDDDK